MPVYHFRICGGRHSSAPEQGFALADKDAAWVEMTKVCGDFIGDVARRLEQNDNWQIELLDESKEPLFRIRVVSESSKSLRLPKYAEATSGSDVTRVDGG